MADIHHVPGRLRIRIPQLKRNPAMADSLEQKLQARPGVASASANTLTGSVLIYYNRACDLEALLEILPRQRHIEPVARAGGRRFESKLANALVWYAVEKAVERSIPLVFSALL